MGGAFSKAQRPKRCHAPKALCRSVGVLRRVPRQSAPAYRSSAFHCLSKYQAPRVRSRFVCCFQGVLYGAVDFPQCDAARAALAGTDLADHFYFGDALYWFKLAYSRYLAEQCSPDGYLKRAQRIVSEIKAPTRSVKEVVQHLRDTERESFEQIKARYFMTDIYPENAQRFTVTFEQIDIRDGGAR